MYSTASNYAWRRLIATESQLFLTRHGLFSSEHAIAIRKILRGCPIVRVSHQPNLFAALNITGLLVWAKKVARDIGGVVVYVGLDYDEANDQRFRSALLPPLSNAHLIHMSHIARKYRHRIAYAVPIPTGTCLDASMMLYDQSIRHYSARLNLQPYRTGFAISMRRQLQLSWSLIDFNMTYLEWCSRSLGGQCILFIPASSYVCSMGPAINQLIREILEADGMLDRQLVWRVCPSCFMRVALSLVNGRILKARWFCTACKLSQTEELEWGLTAYEDKPAFVPRVLLCDMIDLRILQTGVSVSYGSSEGHLLRAKTMYERMHLSQPATHDFLWAPQNMHFVPSQFLNHNLWERGRFSTPLYLSLFGQQKICKEVFDIPLNPMP